jgi:hypothetical protein
VYEPRASHHGWGACRFVTETIDPVERSVGIKGDGFTFSRLDHCRSSFGAVGKIGQLSANGALADIEDDSGHRYAPSLEDPGMAHHDP